MNISNNSEKQVVFSNVINFMRNDFQNTIEKYTNIHQNTN